MTETAISFLARAEGQVVRVQLRDRALKGVLRGADEFINLYLEEVEEVREGKASALPRAVIRGSQVLAIHATKLGPPAAEPHRESVWSGPRADHGGYYPTRRYEGRGRDQRRG